MIFDANSAKNAFVKERWDAVSAARKEFMATNAKLTNSSNLIPAEVFTEIDTRTKRLLTDPTMDVLYNDLRTVSTPISTGTQVVSYRVSDFDEASVMDMSGNAKPVYVKSAIDYKQDPVPVHTSGFSIGWREAESFAKGDWNVLLDEAEASVRSVRRSILDLITGARSINRAGVYSRGILTDTDRVQQIKAPVDFSSEKTTGRAIKDGFAKVLTEAQTVSFILAQRIAYVSPQIYANMFRDYSDTIDKTIFEKVMGLPQISEIKQTSALQGNQIVLGVLSTEYIQLLTAQEIATVPLLRLRPRDAYEFDTCGVVGTQIRVDAAGRTAWAVVK